MIPITYGTAWLLIYNILLIKALIGRIEWSIMITDQYFVNLSKFYSDLDDFMHWPISCHKHQSVYGHIGCDIDDVLDSPAEGQTKGPVHEDIVTGGGGDTDQDEQEVSNCQV